MRTVSFLLLALPSIVIAGRACSSSESRVIQACSDANCDNFYNGPVDLCGFGSPNKMLSCNDEGTEITWTQYSSSSDCTGNAQISFLSNLPYDVGIFLDCGCQEAETIGSYSLTRTGYTDSSCSTPCGENGCNFNYDMRIVGQYQQFISNGVTYCQIFGLTGGTSRYTLSSYIGECTSDTKVLHGVSSYEIGCTPMDIDNDNTADYYILSELVALPTVAPTAGPNEPASLNSELTALEISLLIVCAALVCMLFVSLWYNWKQTSSYATTPSEESTERETALAPEVQIVRTDTS